MQVNKFYQRFYNLAIKNKIVLFYIFLHFTYLTQPLNIGIFQPFQHYHTNAIGKAVQLGNEKFGKLEFLIAFQSFCNQTFKPTTIRFTFKSTGLIPFNPDMVPNKICKKQAEIAQTALQTLYLPLLLLHQCTLQGPASIINYKQNLQRVYTKLKPREKIDSK